jgi:hypothetical protein
MKRCPTCNQVFFDDALSFCTDDGTILEPDTSTPSAVQPPVSSSDLQATMVSPSGSIPGYTPPSYGSGAGNLSPGSAPGSGPGYAPPPSYGSAPGSMGGQQPLGGGPLSQPDWGAQPQQQSWQPPPVPGYGVATGSPSQGLAIASMIVGLVSVTLGWLCLGWLEAIAAVIMGIIALVMANSDPKRYGGKTFAYVGIGTGALSILGTIAIWIIYVFILAAGSTTK